MTSLATGRQARTPEVDILERFLQVTGGWKENDVEGAGGNEAANLGNLYTTQGSTSQSHGNHGPSSSSHGSHDRKLPHPSTSSFRQNSRERINLHHLSLLQHTSSDTHQLAGRLDTHQLAGRLDTHQLAGRLDSQQHLAGAAKLDRQNLRLTSSPASTCTRRSKDRESVRKELATIDQEDLQLCFVNEIASDEEDNPDDGGGRSADNNEDIRFVGEEIARLNISEKAGQIIVPIYGRRIELDDWFIGGGAGGDRSSIVSGQSSDIQSPYSSSGESLGSSEGGHGPEHTFRDSLLTYQRDARRGLMEAKLFAKEKMINQRTPKILNDNLLSLVSLKVTSKLSRRILTPLSTGQLNVILNDFLAQIENLNETLMKELLLRDERLMEQDAMLTDIQDLAEFTKL